MVAMGSGFFCPVSCGHGRSHGWTWGAMAPPNFFFLNIIKYMGTNFSNFVLENLTFVPLKISLILLRALL